MRRIGTIFSLSAAVLLLWVGLALAATKITCIKVRIEILNLIKRMNTEGEIK